MNATELRAVKKTLKKIEQIFLKYLKISAEIPKDWSLRNKLVNDFSEEYNKVGGRDYMIDLNDHYKILFKQQIKRINECDDMWCNSMEQYEDEAPFNIIHDEYYK